MRGCPDRVAETRVIGDAAAEGAQIAVLLAWKLADEFHAHDAFAGQIGVSFGLSHGHGRDQAKHDGTAGIDRNDRSNIRML